MLLEAKQGRASEKQKVFSNFLHSLFPSSFSPSFCAFFPRLFGGSTGPMHKIEEKQS
jgi:hypothetical protein